MKKLIYATTLGLLAITANAQNNWQKGGNNATPPGNPATIGTDASWNSPLGFLTNGFQRMTINHLAFGMPLVPFSAPPFNNLNTLPGTRLTRVGISYDGGNPTVSTMFKIARTLNVPVSDLFDFKLSKKTR